MTRAQRTAAVAAAVDAQRTVHALGADHGVTVGTYDWRLMSMMHRSRTERVRPDTIGSPARPRGPGVSILELTSTTCRFPLWGDGDLPGPEARYCGSARDESYPGPYCPGCRALARRSHHW